MLKIMMVQDRWGNFNNFDEATKEGIFICLSLVESVMVVQFSFSVSVGIRDMDVTGNYIWANKIQIQFFTHY